MNSKSTVNFQVTPIFQGLRWSLILPLLLLFTGLVVAQQYSTGTIAGVVQDETGAIIPGVDITIIDCTILLFSSHILVQGSRQMAVILLT